MNRNIKFSYTVDAKKFPSRIADLLDKQASESSIFDSLNIACDYLRNEEYDWFLLSLSDARKQLELLLTAINDAEQNISAFKGLYDAPQAQQEVVTAEQEPAKQENVTNVPTQTAAVPFKSTEDAFDQLKRLEGILSVVKEMNPKQ